MTVSRKETLRQMIPFYRLFLLSAGLVPFGGCAEGPERLVDLVIRPYLQNPSTTAITIMWTCRGRGRGKILYGLGGNPDRKIEVPKARHAVTTTPGDYIYETRLTGLQPGSDYVYEVHVPGHVAKGSFQTFPENPKAWSFINYGDSRSNPKAHARVAAGFDKHNPAFILHSGDMVETGAYKEWGKYYFEPLRGVIDHLAIWPARGNHEGNGEIYRKLYSLPGNERWYSFDYGNVHVTVLDSQTTSREMRSWCADDLAASKATWKIVMYHKPSYDHGRRKTKWGRKDFLPIFRKYGVDLVLCGHAHGYVRLRPLYTRGENDDHPIVHITSAGGGAPINSTPLPTIPHMAAQTRRYHYMVFTIDGERLQAKVISTAGKTLDEFYIVKKNGRYDNAYLKQALEEKDFD